MSGSSRLTVAPVEDKSAFLALMLASWGSHSMMIDLTVYDCAELDLLGVAGKDGAIMAYASWTMRGDVALLCALHSVAPGQGAAVRLLEGVKAAARARGAARLKAMLTNDNMPGLAFYQTCGFRFSRLHIEAIDNFRSVVPTIVRTGYMDIPIHDALELEIEL
ncbi:GNAT family N-acetyltransferase [Bosea sp. 124]|uniref:GNAT family N-acetyltransferase n=1 Tax=Bosea sp. 124 TaxID=2135642 RepID=UPI000D399C31|nr:GNAT family N-acetyltransferase [Bosea sp. 124]PTM41383.1 acetyltransferase (GNAT) family protein [Bosea sp. 124]